MWTLWDSLSLPLVHRSHIYSIFGYLRPFGQDLGRTLTARVAEGVRAADFTGFRVFFTCGSREALPDLRGLVTRIVIVVVRLVVVMIVGVIVVVRLVVVMIVGVIVVVRLVVVMIVGVVVVVVRLVVVMIVGVVVVVVVVVVVGVVNFSVSNRNKSSNMKGNTNKYPHRKNYRSNSAERNF